MHTVCKSILSALGAFSLILTACQVDSTSPAVATGHAKLVTAPIDANLIPDQYIVVFKNDYMAVNSSMAEIRNLAEGMMSNSGLRAENIRNTYSTALSGFAARLTRDEALDLADNPLVAYIEQDQYVHASVTWGLDRTDQVNLPLDDSYSPAGSYAGNGSGVHAYIIDTGIRASHDDFGGRVGNGYDFVSDDNDPDDCNGHGTHVAGTVGGNTWGMAPGVTLHGVRVLDCAGSGSFADVIAGVDWVTANHISPAVANMSLGGGLFTSLNDAVNNSVAAGVTYAVAAGNEFASDACTKSPASAADALTVGSTTSSDDRSSFSNIGTCLDIFAPGSSITSAWHTSDSATNTISGTSMASPHVCGAAALYLGNNGSASPATVGNALTGDATAGIVADAGSGSPNLLLHVGSGGGGTDPVCGDGVCNGDEDCESCPTDCGECPVCLPRGDSCTTNDECCSDRCRGRRGRRTCR